MEEKGEEKEEEKEEEEKEEELVEKADTQQLNLKRMQPQVSRNMQFVNQKQKFRSKQIVAETGKRWSS